MTNWWSNDTPRQETPEPPPEQPQRPDYPLKPSDPHDHDWKPLSDLDGHHRAYIADYCTLCGETWID